MSAHGKWLLAAGEVGVVAAALAVLGAVVAVGVWAHAHGAPGWALGLVLAPALGAGLQVGRDGRRLTLTYLAWRKGLEDRWSTESDAKRLTESIGSEATDRRQRNGDRGREGPKVPSGIGRHRRRSLGLNRADTKDSKDRERRRGRWVARPEAERFQENIEVVDGCHLWTGKLTDDGYPLFLVKRDGRWVWVKAHRWAWEQEHGPLRPGETLDHVRDRGCEHTHCVHLAHLEPVTRPENARRAAAWRKRHPKDTPKDTVPGGTT